MSTTESTLVVKCRVSHRSVWRSSVWKRHPSVGIVIKFFSTTAKYRLFIKQVLVSYSFSVLIMSLGLGD